MRDEQLVEAQVFLGGRVGVIAARLLPGCPRAHPSRRGSSVLPSLLGTGAVYQVVA